MPEGVKLEAWRKLLTAHAEVVGALEREMEDAHDLPLTWYEVLLYLHESPEGRLRMSDLADTLLLSRSAATRFVDRMEHAGLVRREACTTDARGTFVVMTGEGEARFAATAPFHLEGIRRRFAAHVTEDEAEQMIAALDRVLAASRPVD